MHHSAGYSAFMQMHPYQLIGLLVDWLVLAAIAAFAVPPIRRRRHAGDVAGANKRYVLLIIVIGGVAMLGLTIIGSIRR